jgi:hypothetical protein
LESKERSIESRGKTGKGLVRPPDQSFSGFAPALDASFYNSHLVFILVFIQEQVIILNKYARSGSQTCSNGLNCHFFKFLRAGYLF